MLYKKFLQEKAIIDPPVGLTGKFKIPKIAFDFQRDIINWALKRGRAAIFAGTGLGKTMMELSWADNVVRQTGKSVMIFTPLAVTHQFLIEGDKFGIDVVKAEGHEGDEPVIMVTNYQKIDHYDLSQLGGVILDESSILKHYNGKFRTMLIERCKMIPYRLAATATPAPNDFMELGNHAEFLGVQSYTDMLATFFVHDGGSTQSWRLKGYAEEIFWKWMCTWSIMMTNPNDAGYFVEGFDLPPLITHQHTASVEYQPDIDTGFLFPIEARSLSERLAARRATIQDRVNMASEIVNGNEDIWVCWCNLNDESAMLVKKIEGAVELKGGDTDQKKEDILDRFSDGDIRVLVTKPSICGFGMNWQHCHNTVYVGLNDSFEQVFQSVRRFWRFGQKMPVNAHFIASEIEGAVVANLRRKEADAEKMAAAMVRNMVDLTSKELKGLTREQMDYSPVEDMTIPSWI